jgi:hypothetical protein
MPPDFFALRTSWDSAKMLMPQGRDDGLKYSKAQWQQWDAPRSGLALGPLLLIHVTGANGGVWDSPYPPPIHFYQLRIRRQRNSSDGRIPE